MSTRRPTKQQVEVALRRALNLAIIQTADGEWFHGTESVDHLADILVRAGLAEEPREPGFYWVSRFAGDALEVAELCANGSWLYMGFDSSCGQAPPHSVHSPILPPKE